MLGLSTNEHVAKIAARESGAVIHGTLDDLEAPDDAWDSSGGTVTETDRLDEALRLLAASHPLPPPQVSHVDRAVAWYEFILELRANGHWPPGAPK